MDPIYLFFLLILALCSLAYEYRVELSNLFVVENEPVNDESELEMYKEVL